MTVAGARGSAITSTVQVDVDVDAEPPVTVHSCSRLGRTANPPRFSFLSWLRRRR